MCAGSASLRCYVRMPRGVVAPALWHHHSHHTWSIPARMQCANCWRCSTGCTKPADVHSHQPTLQVSRHRQQSCQGPSVMRSAALTASCCSLQPATQPGGGQGKAGMCAAWGTHTQLRTKCSAHACSGSRTGHCHDGGNMWHYWAQVACMSG